MCTCELLSMLVYMCACAYLQLSPCAGGSTPSGSRPVKMLTICNFDFVLNCSLMRHVINGECVCVVRAFAKCH